MALIHLAECEPGPSKGWEEMPYLAAQQRGGQMCPQSAYMKDELFTTEPVWLDPQGRYGDWIITFTGRAFWPLDPRREDIDPRDIAHALSLLCRYGGHTSVFYSVAEHCVHMSYAVAPSNALWALLHDAAEGLGMVDLPRPVKRHMSAYAAAEDRVMGVVCDRFGLPRECPAEVKEADTRILVDERAALLPTFPRPWKSTENVPALGVPIAGWAPEHAEREYLNRLAELTGAPL